MIDGPRRRKKNRHTEYVLSHKLDAFQNTVSAHYRMPLELREAFKKRCHQYRVSTCFIVRSLINQWLQKPRAWATAVQYEHWEYFKEPMSLIKIGKDGKIVARAL